MEVVITNDCTKPSSRLETDSRSTCEEFPLPWMEPEGSLPRWQELSFGPYPEPTSKLRNLVYCLFKIKFNIIFPSTHGFPKFYLLFRFPGTHIPYAFFISQAKFWLLHPSHCPSSTRPNCMIIMKLLILRLFLASIYFIPQFQIFSSAPCSQCLQ
jgi:hypothetical protein